MRYAQAKVLVKVLVKDKLFTTILVKDRGYVSERIYQLLKAKLWKISFY